MARGVQILRIDETQNQRQVPPGCRRAHGELYDVRPGSPSPSSIPNFYARALSEAPKGMPDLGELHYRAYHWLIGEEELPWQVLSQGHRLHSLSICVQLCNRPRTLDDLIPRALTSRPSVCSPPVYLAGRVMLNKSFHSFSLWATLTCGTSRLPLTNPLAGLASLSCAASSTHAPQPRRRLHPPRIRHLRAPPHSPVPKPRGPHPCGRHRLRRLHPCLLRAPPLPALAQHLPAPFSSSIEG